MRVVRTAALCIAAVCALSAFAADSALATENLPHFGKCFAMAGGAYKNQGCTKLPGAKPEEHKFEWEPLTTVVSFTDAKERETGNLVMDATGGGEISCVSEKAKGEYGPGNLLKNVVFELKGCKALGAPCENEGLSAEEIHTMKLHGEPGVVTKEEKEETNIDGYDLTGEESEVFAEFHCGPDPAVYRGGIVTKAQADSTGGTTGEWTNKVATKVEVEYNAEKSGKQVPEDWTPNGEGTSHSKHETTNEHLETSLAGRAYEPSGFSLTQLQSNASKVKVELRQCESNIVC